MIILQPHTLEDAKRIASENGKRLMGICEAAMRMRYDRHFRENMGNTTFWVSEEGLAPRIPVINRGDYCEDAEPTDLHAVVLV